MSDRETLRIEIANLTKAQAIAIEDMLATWVQLAGWGSSRWTRFFADGDGNFHPQIAVNGANPSQTYLLTKEERWPNGEHGDYEVDFDKIAWRLRGRTAKENE